MITDWLPAAAPSLPGLRRPAPSFSSLLGNPACIFCRQHQSLTLPRRHCPAYGAPRRHSRACSGIQPVYFAVSIKA